MTAQERQFHCSSWLRLWLVTTVPIILGSFLTGCTSIEDYVHNGFKVGPNYRKPPAPVAKEYIDSNLPEIGVQTPELTEWWTVFNDPKLNALIETAYRQNLDVRTAGTRILEARAIRNIATGNLFPQFQETFADYSRNQLSFNQANVAEGIPGFKRAFVNWAFGANIARELDFWGRFRRAIESAEADLDATIEEYDDVLVLLAAEVAATYIEIRTFQERIKYAEANIKIQKQLVDKAEERGGKIEEPSEQAQLRSNLRNTQALKKQLEIGLRIANNKLCVLLGIPVRDLIPELGTQDLPETPANVVVGIPAELLRRRPDIRRAERLIAAQSARIGVATSNLYPQFSLVGTIGYQAENFADLFDTKALFGNIGPSVRWDVLNYGRLLNAIRVEDARFQTAVLNYQNQVLKAGQEVENGIVTFLGSQVRYDFLKKSASDAEEAVRVISLRQVFKITPTPVFVSTAFLTTQQDQLALAKADIALGLIQIYKALGGGWQIRLGNDCPPLELGTPLPGDIPRPQPEQLDLPQEIPMKGQTGVELLPVRGGSVYHPSPLAETKAVQAKE